MMRLFITRSSSIQLIRTPRLRSMKLFFFFCILSLYNILLPLHFFELLPSCYCSIRVIDIAGRWVTLGELANCVREIGQVSTSIAELHVRVLQYLHLPNKIIFPWLLSVYLLVGDFSSKSVLHHFRRDQRYILSHQNEVLVVFYFYLFCNISPHTVIVLV